MASGETLVPELATILWNPIKSGIQYKSFRVLPFRAEFVLLRVSLRGADENREIEALGLSELISMEQERLANEWGRSGSHFSKLNICSAGPAPGLMISLIK